MAADPALAAGSAVQVQQRPYLSAPTAAGWAEAHSSDCLLRAEEYWAAALRWPEARSAAGG